MKKIHLYILLISGFVFTNSVFADIFINKDREQEIELTNTSADSSHELFIHEAEPLGNLETKPSAATQRTRHYSDIVSNVAKKTSLSPALIHALITVESNYNKNAASTKGAKGLMQLMPSVAKRFHVHDAFDPEQNILAGASYLSQLQVMFNGNITLALAAYNAGPEAVIKYGSRIPPYKETMEYVPKVLYFYNRMSNEDLL